MSSVAQAILCDVVVDKSTGLGDSEGGFRAFGIVAAAYIQLCNRSISSEYSLMASRCTSPMTWDIVYTFEPNHLFISSASKAYLRLMGSFSYL